MKSKYFPSYLGFDDMTNEEYNLYFFEIKKGKALEQLMQQTGQVLRDDLHLFKFWAKELLYAFKDMTYSSTYTVNGDITLRNVYISDLGIKVYLKKITFGELRDESMAFHLSIEAKMLNNYARILIEVLNENTGSTVSPDDILSGLKIDPELKAILYECLHAQDKVTQKEQETYDNEINTFIHKQKTARMMAELQEMGDESIPENEFAELDKFKQKIKSQEEEESKVPRAISRKGKNPKANNKNFEEENRSFGVKNEVDLVLQRIAGQKDRTEGDFLKAQGMHNRGMISYSGDANESKSKKQEKYLTV